MNDKQDVRHLLVPPDTEFSEPVPIRESWIFWLTIIAACALLFVGVVQMAKHIHWTIDLLIACALASMWAAYRVWRKW